MRFSPALFPLFLMLLLASCNENKSEPQAVADSVPCAKPDSLLFDAGEQTFTVNDNNGKPIEVKTFELKYYCTGKSAGWGYDLYLDGKRTIHQPIIPAVPGTSSFHSKEDAMKTGQLAANKMKVTESLPTVLVKDLDSLEIKH
jgi:ABC-type Fe3+-hydroxamate transport system substrate-binding protein